MNSATHDPFDDSRLDAVCGSDAAAGDMAEGSAEVPTLSLKDVALSASVLGALFYFDPDDERCAAALAFALSPDAAAQWPGADGSGDAVDQAFALMRRNAETQEAERGETLHQTFARLMVGPGHLVAPPWGSVYTDPESVIFGNLTLDVRAWLRENGVKMHLDLREPEDHFGLMLTMFSWAVRNGASDEALRELLEQHLLPWTPRYLELFGAGSEGTFYEGLGALAAATLAAWVDALDLEPATRRLYR